MENEVVEVKPVEIRKAQAFSLVPRNLDQAMELAKLISDSDLAPKDYRGKPGNVLIAVQMGQEVGLAPMQAIQNIAVINGKPSLYGDAGKAILLAAGFVIQEDDVETIKKTGMGRCRITRHGHPPCERTFSIEDAKAAGLWGKQGPWTQYKERQMAWRAFWFAARDVASDLLKGLNGAEEVIDIEPRDITPMRPAIEQIGPQPYPAEKFAENLPKWTELIARGTKDAEAIIRTVLSAYTLTDEQKAQIRKVQKIVSDATDKKTVVTFAAVADSLNRAKDVVVLDAAADLIREVADEQQRKDLQALYAERKAELAIK